MNDGDKVSSMSVALSDGTTIDIANPGGPRVLQFYPKDMPRPELIAKMREFSFALGVGCEPCPVDQPECALPSDPRAVRAARAGPPPPPPRFAPGPPL